MLEISTEIVCGLITRAREFHAKEEVTIPEEPNNPSGDWAVQVLADHADDMTFQEIKDTIADMEPDQQISLVALMWVGRGDFGPEEWESALEQAKHLWTPNTAEYLMSRPFVADYLEEGLLQFGFSCEE